MHGVSKTDQKRMSGRIGVFLRQYMRRAQPRNEPNDRGYDREIEQYIRRLKPEDLDLLLYGEEDERLNFN